MNRILNRRKKSIFEMRDAFSYPRNNFLFGALVLSCLLFYHAFEGNSAEDKSNSNEALLNQYVSSKGTGIILFDASNIKQFWIDNSVLSKKDFFEILLNENSSHKFESVPLKIQLANVNETQDCKIEIITETKDLSFNILSNKSKIISTSSYKEDFLQYKVVSAVFHMEDTKGLSFSFKFNSDNPETISIKKIVLSFSENKEASFAIHPGVLKISANDVTGGKTKEIDSTSFSLSGKWVGAFSKKKIFVSDSEIKNSVKVKNIGDKPTNIYFGYAPYDKNGNNINNRNNPYGNNNKTFSVVSSTRNSKSIVIDSYPEWKKGCCLALNAKDDLSDFPNFSFVDGLIVNVKKIDENHSEIIFDKPINKEIIPGTKVRIQSPEGATYLYTKAKLLNPGEEITLSSTTKKDESFLMYSPKAFCKGTYYVVPLILSYSVNPSDTNTILISDFTVSY